MTNLLESPLTLLEYLKCSQVLSKTKKVGAAAKAKVTKAFEKLFASASTKSIDDNSER
jgi:hypothetical protein